MTKKEERKKFEEHIVSTLDFNKLKSRKEGYYWVKIINSWVIAFWKGYPELTPEQEVKMNRDAHYKLTYTYRWHYMMGIYPEHHWAEVDERMIVKEDLKLHEDLMFKP